MKKGKREIPAATRSDEEKKAPRSRRRGKKAKEKSAWQPGRNVHLPEPSTLSEKGEARADV